MAPSLITSLGSPIYICATLCPPLRTPALRVAPLVLPPPFPYPHPPSNLTIIDTNSAGRVAETLPAHLTLTSGPQAFPALAPRIHLPCSLIPPLPVPLTRQILQESQSGEVISPSLARRAILTGTHLSILQLSPSPPRFPPTPCMNLLLSKARSPPQARQTDEGWDRTHLSSIGLVRSEPFDLPWPHLLPPCAPSANTLLLTRYCARSSWRSVPTLSSAGLIRFFCRRDCPGASASDCRLPRI